MTTESKVESNGPKTASRLTYGGLCLVALATLMYEILLTRIFSVTMWYNFAFMAISVAMFGMTVGALWVYLRPKDAASHDVKHRLALNSLFFAIATVVSFLIHLLIPFAPQVSLLCLSLLALIYVVVAVPFVFSGICICLCLTKFPGRIGKLYAADLTGAAAGCLLVIAILKVSDGPTAIFVVALLASIGAILFALDAGSRQFSAIALVTSLLLAAFVGINTVRARKQNPFIRLTWVKGVIETPPLYEKWNPFARVAVWDSPALRTKPFGWGLSPSYHSNREASQLFLNIDASAETVLTGFNGDVNPLDYLKYDVTNVAHYLRPGSRILVVGSGGGRDILSALAFDQRSVLAVEINGDIINAVNKRFGDFTGHLDRDPRITFVNDEARSYITRSKDQFDILQVSLIDTWAATAAGAFVLTENSLYTTDGWQVLLDRLSRNGILSFSRWYVRDHPDQMYRLTALASASLLRLGIDDPANHIIIVRCMRRLTARGVVDNPLGVATMLVSKEPFSDHDLDSIDAICKRLEFDCVLTPRTALDSTFSTLASGKDLDRFTAAFPADISPPTDNRPFFFNTGRLRDSWHDVWRNGSADTLLQGTLLVAGLLVIVSVLTLLCIFVPLALTTRRETLTGALPYSVYFAAIGFGFMLVEISQMQRFNILLGHPIYGLSVVLFGLLVSSGIGSYSTETRSAAQRPVSGSLRLLLLLIVVLIFGALTPWAAHSFSSAGTPLRILVATAILLPLGFAMGMAFPLGLKLASVQSSDLTPWLWGINGATSVCASVLAVAISLNSGISAAYWSGLSCYAIAFGAFLWCLKTRPSRVQAARSLHGS